MPAWIKAPKKCHTLHKQCQYQRPDQHPDYLITGPMLFEAGNVAYVGMAFIHLYPSFIHYGVAWWWSMCVYCGELSPRMYCIEKKG